jgi:hypothetical protein
MSFAPDTCTSRSRWALGELDPNKDLNNPFSLCKREPIVYAQENGSQFTKGFDWASMTGMK